MKLNELFSAYGFSPLPLWGARRTNKKMPTRDTVLKRISKSKNMEDRRKWIVYLMKNRYELKDTRLW